MGGVDKHAYMAIPGFRSLGDPTSHTMPVIHQSSVGGQHAKHAGRGGCETHTCICVEFSLVCVCVDARA